MRKINIIVLALIIVSLLVAAQAWARGDETFKRKENVEQQIAALSDQVIQAYLKGDTSFFEEYYADDATIIHSDGKVSTKTQEIEDFKSGTLKYEAIDVHEKKIHAYGDTAVVITLSSAKGTLSGRPFGGDYRTTRVWVKQKGIWKEVAFQSTRVAPSQ